MPRNVQAIATSLRQLASDLRPPKAPRKEYVYERLRDLADDLDAVPQPGRPSSDRIEFQIPMSRFEGPEGRAFRQVVAECFDIKKREIDAHADMSHMTVRCRPSQFGRFAALRCQRGLQNLIRELDPKLIPPVIQASKVDVASRGSKVSYEPPETGS